MTILCNLFISFYKVFQQSSRSIICTELLKGITMLKKIETPTNNIYGGVEFILRGAKKRRSMAMASAKMLNSDAGIQTRLVAIK